MANAIFQRLLEEKGSVIKWKVESAGTWASDGKQASTGSVNVMRERDLDITSHRSRVVTREILSSFDLVLTMERSHQEALRAEFPEYSEKINMVSEMAGFSHDIRDPIGGTLTDYEATAQELTLLLAQGFEKIKSLATKNQSQS